MALLMVCCALVAMLAWVAACIASGVPGAMAAPSVGEVPGAVEEPKWVWMSMPGIWFSSSMSPLAASPRRSNTDTSLQAVVNALQASLAMVPNEANQLLSVWNCSLSQVNAALLSSAAVHSSHQ
ncbi:hypothetical protein D3C84_725580 [compost metagenome]